MLSELSLGEAPWIVLGLILAAPDSDPLVLDQPEDQLGGPYLADTVVRYLHSAKERRHVVVATHNANIVVLGDADLVLPCTLKPGAVALVDSGIVDSQATPAQVVRLLEGAVPAFRERACRYGLAVEDMPR